MREIYVADIDTHAYTRARPPEISIFNRHSPDFPADFGEKVAPLAGSDNQ
jgi:hypothetical protein